MDRPSSPVQCGCADAEETYAQLSRYCDDLGAELDAARAETEKMRERWERAMRDGDVQAVQRIVLHGEIQDLRARVAALEAVADAARTVEGVVSSWSSNGRETVRELTEALTALDAVPAAETTSGGHARPAPLPDPNVLPHTDGWEIRDNVFVTHVVDVRPMTDDEQRAEQLTPDPREPWLAECICGARMLPLLPGEANAWMQGHLGTRPAAEAGSGEV